MYIFRIHIQVFNKDNNLTHIDEIYEKECGYLEYVNHLYQRIKQVVLIFKKI